MVREIIGMPSGSQKRARIGVSFNDEELEMLGKRYDIDPQDKANIRRKLTEEVVAVLVSAENIKSFDEKILLKEQELPIRGNPMKELKRASDSIHQKFQRALAARNLITKTYK